jgi:hypothetical protein
MILNMESRYLESAEVSKLLKNAIIAIDPSAKVNVRVVSNYLTSKGQEVRAIDVFLRNFNRIPLANLNRIAEACRSHQGIDPLYGTNLGRWILAGEIAEQKDHEIKVMWRKDQQMQLLIFAPEKVTIGCERVNLYIGRGTTGPFTGQNDFSWVMENFTVCDNGYAYRKAIA